MTDPRFSRTRLGALVALTLALSFSACDSGPGDPPTTEPPVTEPEMVTRSVRAAEAEMDTTITSATLTVDDESVGENGAVELTRQAGETEMVSAAADGFEPGEAEISFDPELDGEPFTIALTATAVEPEPPAEDVCEDPDATNTGDPLPCEYPDEPEVTMITITGWAEDSETGGLVNDARWIDLDADTLLVEGGEVTFPWEAGVQMRVRVDAEGYGLNQFTLTTDEDRSITRELVAVEDDPELVIQDRPISNLSFHGRDTLLVSSADSLMHTTIDQHSQLLMGTLPKPAGPFTFYGTRKLDKDIDGQGFTMTIDCGAGRGGTTDGRTFTSPVIADVPGVDGWHPYEFEVPADFLIPDERCNIEVDHQAENPGDGNDVVVIAIAGVDTGPFGFRYLYDPEDY